MIFAPVYDLGSVYSQSELDASSINIADTTGQLVALDAATGEILLDVPQPTGQLAATVTNDVVFSAGLDGVIHGYSVLDGSKVFRFQAPAGIDAPLAASGDYLLVPAGGPLLASSDPASPAPTTTQELIALTIGGTVQATPQPGTAKPWAQAAVRPRRPVETTGAPSPATPRPVWLASQPSRSGTLAEPGVDETGPERQRFGPDLSHRR